MPARLARLLPGLWGGLLLCIAAIAAPAAFALLPLADAGRLVGRLFMQEAWTSLVLAALLLGLLRPRHGGLLAGTIVCTLLGYFALQPLMAAARAGQGSLGFGLNFGQLHLISTVCYGLKTLLVLRLAWCTTAVSRSPSS